MIDDLFPVHFGRGRIRQSFGALSIAGFWIRTRPGPASIPTIQCSRNHLDQKIKKKKKKKKKNELYNY